MAFHFNLFPGFSSFLMDPPEKSRSPFGYRISGKEESRKARRIPTNGTDAAGEGNPSLGSRRKTRCGDRRYLKPKGAHHRTACAQLLKQIKRRDPHCGVRRSVARTQIGKFRAGGIRPTTGSFLDFRFTPLAGSVFL